MEDRRWRSRWQYRRCHGTGLVTITNCYIRHSAAPKQRFPLLRRCLHGMILDLPRPMVTVAGRLTPSTGNALQRCHGRLGTTDSIVLVGWSADLGSSWSSVSNLLAAAAAGNNAPLQAQLAGQQGFFGVSTTGYTATGIPQTPVHRVCNCCKRARSSNLLAAHAIVFGARSRTHDTGLGGLGWFVPVAVPSSTQIS